MKLQRKIKPEPMVPMASMSDIAFLLIIFFMVSTTFMKEAGIKAKPPKAKQGEELKKKSLATITVDENGESYFDGDKLSIASLGKAIQERIAQRNPKDRIVVLKCDKEIKSVYFIKAIEQISQAGATLEIWVEPKGKKEAKK